MTRQPMLIVLAAVVTALDTVVFVHSGLPVWRVVEATLWLKMTLMLFGSVGIYSLIDVWASALAGVPSITTRSITRSREQHSEQLSGGADV